MHHTSVRRLAVAAMCVALGVVLPQAVHAIPNAGSVLLPMHIPVLLCGLACGWPYGLACGLLAPLLSSLITGMPGPAYLPAMLCELATYGLISGLMSGLLQLKNRTASVYVQLIAAMLLGRVVYGVVNALIFQAGTYTFQIFFAAAFVTALPGIIIQLLILPPILVLLEKARVLPRQLSAA